jgi:hypothetical protein
MKKTMTDIQKVLQTKERILDFIKKSGPNLPVKVASAVGMSNLFTAAFMSELIAEQKLKISNMRVGSSPLYYIESQEEQLQKYVEYLNHKEKEAFRKLKESQILQDDELDPAIRIAMRSIKDFAVQLQIMNDNNEQKIFWKIHTLSNNLAKELIENKLNPKPVISEAKKQLKEEKLEEQQTKEAIEKTEEINIFDSKENKQTKKAQKELNFPFVNTIKEILNEKNFEILSESLIKKKEYVARIRTDTHLGKQEFYLVAKDKKKVNIEDLVSLQQKSQTEKMPAIILSPGDIDKKALDYYKEWKNLLKHEKIKL